MKPDDKQALNAAVLRVSGEDPIWLGYWLKFFTKNEGIPTEELAKQLDLSIDALVLLCLCRTPRAENFQDDLKFVCQRTGAKDEVLARIIRQGQALLKWNATVKADTTGWLLAASDSNDDVEEDSENPETDGNER